MIPQRQAPHGHAARGTLDHHTPRDRRALFIRSTWRVAIHTTDELLDPIGLSLVHGASVIKFTLLNQVDGRALLGEHLEGGGEVGKASLPAAHQAAVDAQARCDGAARTADIDAGIDRRTDPVDAAEEGRGEDSEGDGEGDGKRQG